ncbi:hypothetical protein GDO81_029867 [Engystomops pustulosus]|uniref:LEM domain-containing protein n=1 Tax=Engystomops pustulosus TaxID=76066 RepID=A0AAV6ZC33_ENGPU|nr:hypothetical protein GDO81_029867 [Engystomops pustulosus]
MSDEKLRRDLIALGYTPGPITDTTRKLLEKKLQKLRDGAKKSRNSTSNARRSRRQDPRDDSEEEEEDGEEEYLPVRRGTVQEDSRRGDNRRNLRASTEESNCLLGDKSQRSSLSYNRYTSDTLEPERSSLSYNRYPSDTLEPERSSLSYNRYPSDTLEPERSSLSHNRYPRDTLEPERSSLSYNRYPSDTLEPERSSLTYNRYPSDTQERRSLGYNSSNLGRSSLSKIRYSLDSPECKRSSVGYGSFLSTSPERSSHGDNRSSEEVRYRSLGDRSRGYSTSTYISSSRPAPDYLGHKTQLGLNLEKGSHFKPAWPKKLEYYLSRLLRVLCVILALVFTGILIAKSGILTSSQNYDSKFRALHFVN